MQHPGNKSRHIVHVVVLGALALFTTACSSNPKRVDAWPIYYHEEIGDRTTTEYLWPFGGGTEDFKKDRGGFWPVTTQKNKETGRKSVHGVYPFYIHEKSEHTDKTLALPFYMRMKKDLMNGQWREDYTIFPLLAFCTSPEENKYFAFFPFYGTVRKRFARDEIHFVMFPIYSRSKLNGHTAQNVLFPLIAWTYGGNRESSRVLPFYTYYHKEGGPELYSILWPIIHFSHSTGEERYPRNMFYIFPLFGWDNTFKMHTTTVLWPFFTYASQPGTDYYRWVGPWPIVRLQRDKNLLRRQFWPFYGYLYDNKATSRFIMWPIYRQYDKNTEKFSQHDWSVLYIYQDKKYYNKVTQQQSTRRMFWPLFRYFSSGGSSHFSALSPLWFWNEGGFERNHSRFWRIVEYKKDAQRNEKMWHFLWRVVRYERIRDYKTFNLIGPLFRYERETNVQTKVSILSGLFTLGSRNGHTIFKLFYIPFASGGPDTSEAAPADSRS